MVRKSPTMIASMNSIWLVHTEQNQAEYTREPDVYRSIDHILPASYRI